MGSPPPMRGIHAPLSTFYTTTGLTPAHAGNTSRADRPRASRAAHPRPCGEYRFSRWVYVSLMGSPPPMRGIHGEKSGYEHWQMGSPPPMRGIPFHRSWSGRCLGFTPAHAGNTRQSTLPQRRYQIHPRPCGEYTRRNGGNKPKPEPTNREKL